MLEASAFNQTSAIGVHSVTYMDYDQNNLLQSGY